MESHTDFSTITPQGLYTKMTNEEDFVLIDALTDDHFEKVHIPGAKNACVFEVVFLNKVEGIISDRKKEIIVYGSSSKSMDAVTAAEKLVRANYANVNALAGGLALWREEGYPLEGEHIEVSDFSEQGLRLGNGTYRVRVDTSVIEWAGRNPNRKHFGTVQLAGGDMTVKDGVIGGSFEIDVTSLRNIDLEGDDLQPVLLSHLKSDDFFFVKLFPRAFFSIRSAKPVEEPTLSSPNLEVKGTLELRGIKKEVEFPATASLLPEGAVTVEAHFDFDRTRWGIIYGSSRFFEYLGMHLVFDLISIQLRLILERNDGH
jgi:rhodanese-related sulfurtransferase